MRVLGTGLAVFLLSSLYVQRRYSSQLRSILTVPETPVAIVFGAGLAADQVPSPMLAERLDTAIALYRAGKVKKLLVSGDTSDRYHDETSAMLRYATSQGLPKADLLADFAGFSTYDTCVRAKDAFGVDSATLVSQEFHLPRALYIANSLGIHAYGVAADRGSSLRYGIREVISRPLAMATVWAHLPAKNAGYVPPPAK